MKQHIRRFFALLLALSLCLGLAAPSRAAEEADAIGAVSADAGETLDAQGTTASGTCGKSLKWSLKGGTLTISGSGKMKNYGAGGAPWSGYTGITKAVILDGARSIGSYAFAYLENLTSVTIPSSVTDIGAYAFSDCDALTGVSLPSGMTAVSDGTFLSCAQLTGVKLPDGVTSIGSVAFAGCERLKKITVPDSVTSIGVCAFSACTRLSSLKIGSGVTSIGEYAFCDCKSLTSVTVPDNVRSIGRDAFYGCTKMKSITLRSKTTKIGNYALGYYGYDETGKENGQNLSGIVLTGYSGSTIETYAQKNGMTFRNCKTGKKASYPSKVTLTGVSNVRRRKLRVKWKKNTSGSGYQIQYSTDKSFRKNVTTKTVKSNKTTSATYSRLKKGKRYYVRIRSYRKISGKTWYSSWSSTRNVKIRK